MRAPLLMNHDKQLEKKGARDATMCHNDNGREEESARRVTDVFLSPRHIKLRWKSLKVSRCSHFRLQVQEGYRFNGRPLISVLKW